MEQIRALFLIERELKGLELSECLRIRKEQSQLYITAIEVKMKELHNVLPQSPLGRAIKYTQKLWPGLTVFLTDPEVPIHSNAIEQAVRSPVQGRVNHYGSHSLETAEVASIWYSLISTCLANQVDPRIYLEKILFLILEKKPFPMPWDFKVDPNVTGPGPLAAAQSFHTPSS